MAALCTSAAASYFNKIATSDNIATGSTTEFSADGNGTLIDAHTIKTISYGINGNDYTYTMNASSGGTLDVSGLTTISRTGTPNNGNVLFQASGGGTIKLNSLQSINQDNFGDYGYTQTRFNLGASNLSLPSLISTRFTDFNIPAGGSIYVPVLQTFKDHSTLELSANTTFNGPPSWTLAATIRQREHRHQSSPSPPAPPSPPLISPSSAWASPSPPAPPPSTPPTSPTSSRAGLSSIPAGANVTLGTSRRWMGAHFVRQRRRRVFLNKITATSDNIASGTSTEFSADGNGTLIDAHTIKTITYGAGGGTTYTYTMNASSGGNHRSSLGSLTISRTGTPNDVLGFSSEASGGGTIKLNSLQSINQDNFGSHGYTQTRFLAGTNSTISIGNLAQSRLVDFEATGAAGKILFLANATIGSGSSFNLAANGIIESRGNFSHSITGSTNFTTSTGILDMDGTGVQTLEVAGADSGAAAPGNNGNFGFGQLQIGTQSAATEVDLVDAIDNGNRGATPKPESLYLFGLNGQGGLILNDGSMLVIGNLNTYAFENGSWTNLQSLFTGNQTIVPFTTDGSNGFIAKNLSLLVATWSNLGDGPWDTASNWSTNVVPLNANDVRITPIAGVTVTGPAGNSHIRSLTIDALPAGSPSILNLTGPGNMTVTTTVQINARGQINLQGGSLTVPQLNVTGVFTQSTGSTLTASAVVNSGRLHQPPAMPPSAKSPAAAISPSTPSAAAITDGILQSTLTINGSLQIRPNATATGTTKINTLTIAGTTNAWTGMLDLTNNKLIVEPSAATKSTALATLQNQLAFGRTHTAGIFTSAARQHGPRHPRRRHHQILHLRRPTRRHQLHHHRPRTHRRRQRRRPHRPHRPLHHPQQLRLNHRLLDLRQLRQRRHHRPHRSLRRPQQFRPVICLSE